MKVVVFGGSGFVGSHVVDVLTAAGHDVIIYDLVKSPYLQKSQKMVVGDITDEKSVDRVVKGCDVIYNFAGISDIEEAKNKPLDAVKNNILGNTILLEAAKENKIKRFIFASTLYVYSKTGSFYRGTKQACELLIENYHEIYNLSFTILRYGSLYGPRAQKGNWIRDMLEQAFAQGKITRYGDGEELREYIHVYDAARLSLDILSDEYKNQHVIITGNRQIKIKDLLVMVREMLDDKVKIEYSPQLESIHYEITPYTFSPKLAKVVQSRHYVDLGQGILDLMGHIYKAYAKD